MSPQLFDDDFAEASIEAISLAASIPSKLEPDPADHRFPLHPQPPPPRTSSSPNAARMSRLMSSLLPLTTSSKKSSSSSLTTPDPSSPTLSLPASRLDLAQPHPRHLWHQHVFSLPHNALRAELIDLCAMLHALTRDVPQPRLHLLAEWFPPFRQFVSSYLVFETDVLLPWAYAGVDDTRLLHFRRAMAPHHARIAHLLDELANVVALTSTRSPHAILPLLVRAARDLVTPVLAYLEREERVLPALVHARRTRVEAANVERLMARRMNPGLLLRWVPNSVARLSLRAKYLPPHTALKYAIARQRVTARHLAVVHDVVSTAPPV